MNKMFFFVAISLLTIGCKDENLIGINGANDDFFSENSMLNSVFTTSSNTSSQTTGNSPSVMVHDSTRNHRMWQHLKRYLELTDVQVDSIKIYAGVLKTELIAIRDRVKSGEITREDAKVLVKAARLVFVEDVKSVLTDTQKVKFDRWLVRFWHRHGRP